MSSPATDSETRTKFPSLAETEKDIVQEQFFSDAEYHDALQVLITKARTDFLTYFHLFNPQGHSAIILGDLHRYLIDLVQRVFEGREQPNNAVSVPPQHGKSTLLSIEAPSWVLGAKPTAAVAITGFSHTLVTKFSKAIRARLEAPIFQLVFPGVLPVRGSNRMDEWETQTGGSVIAKSSGSKLTGRRVDWLVMDDVHAGRAEAESPTMRRKVIEWYFADCLTRLHPTAKTFLVGTRWHPHDLIGHLTSDEYNAELEQEGREDRRFNYINIPAIAEEGTDDPVGRQSGEALFPEERPLSYLKGIKAAIPAYEWDSQYQGHPRSAASGQIDLSNMVYYTPDRIPWREIDEVVRGWDLALSEKQSADYTAGCLLGINWATKGIYILNVYRRRMNWAKLRQAILDQSLFDLRGYPPEKGSHRKRVLRMGMEGVSGFRSVVDDVRQELLGEVKVELRNPPTRKEGGSSKLLRAQPWLNKLEKGLVHCVRADWTKEFIDELDNFPDGKNDDQVDAVSIAHELFEKRTQLLIA